MSPELALAGGRPVRGAPLPYSRHLVDDEDIRAVNAVLRSEWLTTGPQVARFEAAFAAAVGAAEAVAVSSGTAALHAAMNALGIGPGDEVIVPAITFAATANCVALQGGTPVFADVDADTLLLGPAQAEERVTGRTRAIVAVDYAGQPCDYAGLRQVAERHGLRLVADACHAIGGADGGRAVGTLAELSAFSLHAVKPLTAGEGGIVTTDDSVLAARMRRFRNHGIDLDHDARVRAGTWEYDVIELGFNYRLSDIQCALAASQLAKVPVWVERRQAIARRYDAAFADLPAVRPLAHRQGVRHARHLYVVRLEPGRLRADRGLVYRALRAEGIGVNVHFLPVHLHSYYRARFGTRPGDCPVAETAYGTILSLPLFAAMAETDVASVIAATRKVLTAFSADAA
jgi:perosamine synthetase